MATPTRSQAVSTPKNPLSSTPSRPMASPRPGTSAAGNKTFAYKSPAVKTPASAHGYHVSVSSQPSSTPLAPGAIHDELLALNSPVTALINSIAPTGLTPLSSGQDGLGISTQMHGTSGRDGHVPRNPEAERLQRLQQVADTLRTRAIGHGITREGVERVARLQGFEPLWDEDDLTIAGNTVELDIHFSATSKDRVRDLVLKLNSTTGESQVQERATDILKKDVGAGFPIDQPKLGQNLEAFSTNLQYLSRLDHIEPSINCFEIVGGLFNTFRSIWDEEKKRMRWRSETAHYCNGSVGRASMDRKPNLGLSVDYWRNRHHDTSKAYQDVEQSNDELNAENNHDIWTGRFYCEAGNPSITTAQKWTSDEVLAHEVQPESLLNAGEELWKPDWLDPLSATILESSKDGEDAMIVDKPGGNIPQSINVCFVCTLEPDVLLPINTAISLNNEINMIDIDQAKAITYQQALQTARNEQLSPPDPNRIESRWSRSLPCVDASGNISTSQHSYALYSAAVGTELWFYPVSKLRFNHPRQLAATLPILRQHALLWTLLRTLVINPPSTVSASADTSGEAGAKPLQGKKRVTKRSNAKQLPSTLGTINFPVDGALGAKILPVDISLDVMSDITKPRLDFFLPIGDTTDIAARNQFLHVSVAIGSNGKVEAVGVAGCPDADTAILNAKVARMLSVTEDPGMVLHWIVEHVRAQG